MNNYTKIFLVALLLLGISYINEINDPNYIYSKKSLFDYIHIYTIRYLHYIIFLFSSLYLFFFNGIGTNYDIYIFLVLSMSIVLGWKIFDSSCWISYLELLFYNIYLENRKTSLQPAFIFVFGKYNDYVMILSGLLFLFNVIVLLYYVKPIHILYKILYYILFLYLLLDGMIMSRWFQYLYSSKNKNILFLKNLHHTYISYMKYYFPSIVE